MDCNKKCYWQYEGTCVYEDELKYDEGKPSKEESCPNWLRKDFEEHLRKTHYRIIMMLNKRNCEELEQIEQFILSQRGLNPNQIND